jgi:ubiquinone/menaquinone biosynthesis C-methylase UbiE
MLRPSGRFITDTSASAGAFFLRYTFDMESSFLNPAKVVSVAGIDQGHMVADFGAGAGFFTRAVARAVAPAGSVWAVDMHRDMLPRIKNLALAEGLHNVEVVHGDASHIGGTHLPENTFDFCLVTNLLFAVECRGCVAEEAARVLKRGGKVVLVDWLGSYGGLGPHARDVVGKVDALKFFEPAGFTFVSDIPAGEFHWGCILKKK